jgi:hypothetical protein
MLKQYVINNKNFSTNQFKLLEHFFDKIISHTMFVRFNKLFVRKVCSTDVDKGLHEYQQ